MSWYSHYPPYKSVAQRKAEAERRAKKLASKGAMLEPAAPAGKKLASTFWGQAWNRNLERYQDYQYRLPRGRSYVRNGAVIDLKVEKGRIKALVSGSELYELTIHIQPLKLARWTSLKGQCSGQITSLIGLLQGKLPPSIMEAVTKEEEGLFPEPCDIRFDCNCPDYADLCKHCAAAAYGVSARLDRDPGLLFLLRGVDHMELITSASDAAAAQTDASGSGDDLDDLSGIFGIELDPGTEAPTPTVLVKEGVSKSAEKSSKKKSAKKPVRKVSAAKPAKAPVKRRK
jgi:uncharacterized Zn finger protein